MKIKFTKMQALGNDFVLIDCINQQVSLTRDQIKFIADRKYGVGCDQVLLIGKPTTPQNDFLYKIFNADGTQVEQCGNGARCVGLFVQQNKLSDKNNFNLETINNSIEVRVLKNNQIMVNMGVPKLKPKYRYPLKIDHNTVDVSVIDMGNPHCVLFVDKLANAPVADLSPKIQKHADFSQGVNVGFVQTVNSNSIKLRVYERGVGETLACGSGACAAVVAGRLLGLFDTQVAVALPGGELMISWENKDAPVWMMGPAVRVFDGVIYN